MDKTKQLEELEAFYKAFLTALYFEKYDELNYENVDEFYAYLGYDLELAYYVEYYISSTSNLLKLLKTKENCKQMETYKEALEQLKQSPWHEFLATQSDLDAIVKKIDQEAQSKTIFPSPDDVFRVFETRPEDIKVVILGQDPYYNTGQANGLAFSVNDNVATPRSLKNIFKELESDLGLVRTNPNLTDWHKQGVFLLNTALTVPEKEPNAHKKLWTRFTNDLLDYLTEVNPDILYIMWGENAIKHSLRIEPKLKRSDLILYSSHPSPLSARHSFFGSKPFSWVNYQLRCQRKTPIKWT